MLQNRLAILMAQRDLKITSIGKETGISRSTLNNIRKNATNTIRLSTLKTLLDYMEVTPNDFFNYNGMHEPFDSKDKNPLKAEIESLKEENELLKGKLRLIQSITREEKQND